MARRGHSATTRGFLAAVNQWTRETEGRSEAAFQNGALDFYDAMRAATPVLTGNLRDSLVASKSGPVAIATSPTGNPGVTGNSSGVERSIAEIMSLKLGDKITFSYNAVYWKRVNYGFVGYDSLGRYYNQPGYFWIEQTGAKYRSIMRAAATRLKMASK